MVDHAALTAPGGSSVVVGGDGDKPLLLILTSDGPARLMALRNAAWADVGPAPPFDGLDVGEQGDWADGGFILAWTGVGANSGDLIQDQVIRLDSASSTWTIGGRPPAVTHSTMPIWTGRIAYFFRGREPGLAYQPDIDRWFEVAPAPRDEAAAAIWADDRVLVWGGSVGESIESSTSGAEFVPDSATFGSPR